MLFGRSRGLALRRTLIRVSVELGLATALAMAIGTGNLLASIAALMMGIYIARAVLWFIQILSAAIAWRLDRQSSIEGFASALQAVRLPVHPEILGKDVVQTLAVAATAPSISREAAAFAYSTQGYVEALHVHADPLVAAMVTSDIAEGLRLHAAGEAPSGPR